LVWNDRIGLFPDKLVVFTSKLPLPFVRSFRKTIFLTPFQVGFFTTEAHRLPVPPNSFELCRTSLRLIRKRLAGVSFSVDSFFRFGSQKVPLPFHGIIRWRKDSRLQQRFEKKNFDLIKTTKLVARVKLSRAVDEILLAKSSRVCPRRRYVVSPHLPLA
jgi:hypothetical protein